MKHFLWNGLAKETRDNYKSVQKMYETYCIMQSKTTWPAQLETLGEFTTLRAIGGLGITKVKPDTIAGNLSALRSVHVDRRLDEGVFDSPWLKRIVSGIRRTTINTPTKQAQPITMDILERITKPAFTGPTGARSRESINFDVAAKVAFAGCLRMGEFTVKNSQLQEDHLTFTSTRLTRSDVAIAPGGAYATLRLKRSKADYDHRGVEIVLARTDSPTCPVKAFCELLVDYPAKGDTPEERAAEPLFATSDGEPISRNWMIAQLRNRIKRAGIRTPTKFSGHSFRRGAAQHASDNGLTHEDIQDLGRWKSDSFKRYFKRSLRSRLELNTRFLQRTNIHDLDQAQLRGL